MDAESGVERLARGGLAGVVRGAEEPEIGNAGVVELAFIAEDAGADAVGGAVETFGEDGSELGAAVTVAIFEEADFFADVGEAGEVCAEVAAEESDAVFDGAGGEVLVEPIHVAADVEDAFVKAIGGADGGVAVGFGDEDAAFFVDVKGDGIGEHRFSGEEFDFPAGRDFEALHGGLGFGGRFGGEESCRG